MEEQILNRFGQHLRELRAKNKLSLENVGEKLNIHRETVRKYETNPSTMNAEVLLKMLNLYNEEPDIFFAKIYGKMP